MPLLMRNDLGEVILPRSSSSPTVTITSGLPNWMDPIRSAFTTAWPKSVWILTVLFKSVPATVVPSLRTTLAWTVALALAWAGAEAEKTSRETRHRETRDRNTGG